MILDKTLTSTLNIKIHLILCLAWKARLKLSVIALHKDVHSNRYSRLFLEFQYV